MHKRYRIGILLYISALALVFPAVSGQSLAQEKKAYEGTPANSLQIASFEIKENADRFLKNLRDLGFEAVIRGEKANEKTVYRVFIIKQKDRPKGYVEEQLRAEKIKLEDALNSKIMELEEIKGKHAIEIKKLIEEKSALEAALKTAKEGADKIPKKTGGDKAGIPKEQPEAGEKERINLRIILVRTEQEAQDILREIHGGRQFALVANEKSLDEVSRSEYGNLGEVELKTLDKVLAEAVSALGEGQISGVIKLGNGMYALAQATNMTFYREGERAFASGDFDAARENLENHIRMNPDSAKSYIMLGRIYESGSTMDEAEKMYASAVKFKPNLEEPYLWLGRFYLKSGRHSDAAQVFDEGLRHNPYSERLKEGIEYAEILMMSETGKSP